MTFAQLRAAAILLLLASQSFAQSAPRIAIIIDDLGYHLAAGHRAVALPGPVVCAILPGTPRAAHLANAAEPGSITLDTTREAFADTFAAAIDSVPFAVGVNGHRGSLLTRHPGHMSWLMEEILRAGGLYFVDSYTTNKACRRSSGTCSWMLIRRLKRLHRSSSASRRWRGSADLRWQSGIRIPRRLHSWNRQSRTLSKKGYSWYHFVN
jgi:polysaccharide deacetylase 2 family uncharacterized protein YibQ